MKKTGRRVYLSGICGFETADAVINKTPGDPTTSEQYYFQNILVDERKGYAYKVTFASTFPDVSAFPVKRDVPYALQTFSTRELRKMTPTQLQAAAGIPTAKGLAAHNRTVGIVGSWNTDTGSGKAATPGYQNNYVIKGDAMITEALSICVNGITLGRTGSEMSYYIELDEYQVNDNEEILLLLNERAQNAGNPEGV